MQLMRFSSIADFYKKSQSFLLANEAENSSILGAILTLLKSPERLEEGTLLIAVLDQDKVCGTLIAIPGKRWIFSQIPHVVHARLVDSLMQQKIYAAGFMGPSPTVDSFARTWSMSSKNKAHLSLPMQIYALSKLVPHPLAKGRFRKAWLEELSLLQKWSADFSVEAGLDESPQESAAVITQLIQNQQLFVWDDGGPRTMAAFNGRTPNGARVVMVYTPPALRSRGYARSCSQELSRWLLESGCRWCFLYADTRNPTANRLYSSIGYETAGLMNYYQIRK